MKLTAKLQNRLDELVEWEEQANRQTISPSKWRIDGIMFGYMTAVQDAQVLVEALEFISTPITRAEQKCMSDMTIMAQHQQKAAKALKEWNGE